MRLECVEDDTESEEVYNKDAQKVCPQAYVGQRRD